MIKLHARLNKRQNAEPFVARVAKGNWNIRVPSESEIYFIENGERPPQGFGAYLSSAPDLQADNSTDLWPIPEEMSHLSDGDIVRLSPASGELWVMYRRHSPHNSMLLTEQCNSNCIMCSQPPKNADDSHLLNAYLEAIPLMSQETVEIGITGGEPTLLGDTLLEVLQACKAHLPATSLHMLSNGRRFNYLSLCQAIANIEHHDLMIGIPLYSDIAHCHDFVVQSAGAFDQTLRGILNLARCGQQVEIRMVLHRETIDRLPQFARFISRNLPFVEHVALMGLETTGYVRANLESLWVDPFDYREQMHKAVTELVSNGMNVSIYNHQLCTIPPELWPLARKSISDWKNEYVDGCQSCAVVERCGGFFASSSLRRSAHIRPIQNEETTLAVS